MNPRIFVSSTFYDLKYAREEIETFIRGFGFDPILAEMGDIGYTPGVNLDESCYAAMKNSDMAILIVGGRYGSPASGEDLSQESFNEFSSVTRNEFRTAIANKIPIFVFIEARVYSEYKLYTKNYDSIENQRFPIQFASTDHINVFRFISEIHTIPKLAIFEFTKVSDIKDKLRLQWADLFRNYLSQLKQNVSTLHQVEPQLTQIYSTLREVQIMVQKMGSITLTDSPLDMNDVLNQQHVEYAASKIAGTFEFVSSLETDELESYLTFFIKQLFEAKRRNLLECPFSNDPEEQELFYSLFEHKKVFIAFVNDHLAYEENIFKDSDEFQAALVRRLCATDYLKKMKFLA